jgi:hypothetical protein
MHFDFSVAPKVIALSKVARSLYNLLLFSDTQGRKPPRLCTLISFDRCPVWVEARQKSGGWIGSHDIGQ